MFKTLIFLFVLLPLGCFAQFTISGRVLNQADTKPVANASVFLSNSSVGNKTAYNGTFSLSDAKPGKYELIVSIIGFETYSQFITVNNSNVTLPDITIFPKTISLKEVSIKPVIDPNRERNFELFKEEFLGTSELAKECKIVNPDMLDLAYDETTSTLTASSADFLEIKNAGLGYKIKYLLKNFKLDNKDKGFETVHYEGFVLFEELKGVPSQQRRWRKSREEVYENSPMHFLRSALGNRIEEEGFRVQQVSIYTNPNRPPDSLIEAKIRRYKELKSGTDKDSLSFWVKKSKLPKTFQKLMPYPLNKQDLIQTTDQPGQYSLGCDYDWLYVAYNKDHHFHINDQFKYLYNAGNTENTLIGFNSPEAFFNINGVISNPYSLMYYGVWGRNRVAGLLPIDYQVPDNMSLVIENNFIKKLTNKLDTFSSTHITEKAYLHFDKPYYAAGDTIYFKAYVTLGERHELSNLSGVLHVDLINTKNNIDQSIKLQLDRGVAWGDFALPDSLPKGNYRVRAYTQWMRSAGDDVFFDKAVEIASIKNTPVSESIVRQTGQIPKSKADIQFFPEGGNMTTGIRSKIAFKAIGANGLGVNVKGVIVDNTEKAITTFSATHLGMGYFYLTPEEGKTYKARLTYANGTENVIDLPQPEAKGIVLFINNDSIPKATVRIAANNAYYLENRGKDYTLVIYSGGIATTVTCRLDSPSITMDILKRRLHTGIATITLFSPNAEPLAERLLFVQNYDQLNIGVNTNKSSYTKREKVKIELNVKNRADESSRGHFSVSVTDESKVPVDEYTENTIISNILLTSDLKGYVEQPNYYFTDTSTSARNNLDVLMLTQGYRRFTWRQVLDNSYPPIAYQAEKALEINGMVKNLSNKPIDKGTITLVPTKGGPLLSAVSDDNGMFHFSNLIFADTTHFVLSAINKDGQNSTKITYFADKPVPVTTADQLQNTQVVSDTAMAVYLENTKKDRNELINYGRGKGIMLKQVNIRDKKLDDQYKTQSLAGAGFADQVMHADEIERVQGRLFTSLNGRLRGISFLREPGGQIVPFLTINLANPRFNGLPPQMLVVIDGVENGDYLGLQAADVETVEVLKNASASMYGIEAGGGVLIITTKQGGGLQAKDIVSIGVLPIAPRGFYKAREFYSPKYDNTDLAAKKRDFRSTIYWKPELVTDKDGNASFEYYNADGSGTYRVVIEGIDDKGNLGRQVYRYKVE